MNCQDQEVVFVELEEQIIKWSSMVGDLPVLLASFHRSREAYTSAITHTA